MVFSIIYKSQLESTKRLDAEYYQPEFLDLIKKIESTNSWKYWRDIKGQFITGPFGSEFNVSNYVVNGEFRYVRGKDVKDFFLLDDDNVYIPKLDFERLKKYSLKPGDILISVVGTLGNVCIVDDSIESAIFSCKSTIFRSEKINPYYLTTFLNSDSGKKLLSQKVRGALQTGLNIEDLRSVIIYIPSNEIQEDIASIIIQAKQLFENSKNFYRQAEKLLLEELGLNDFEKGIEDVPNFCVVNLSEVKTANRIDAEYFQLKYAKLIEKLRDKNTKPLSDAVEIIPAKFNTLTKPEELFKYVELADINSSTGIIDGFATVLGKEAPSRAKRILNENDVIVSSVEGSLEKAALAHKDQNGYLASTGFFQLRGKEILPEVLLIMAKSLVFQMQLEKQCAGTILTAVPHEAIKNLLVPILPQKTQGKIADLVRKSHEARQKANGLLETAKRKVEESIENRF